MYPLVMRDIELQTANSNLDFRNQFQQGMLISTKCIKSTDRLDLEKHERSGTSTWSLSRAYRCSVQ